MPVGTRWRLVLPALPHLVLLLGLLASCEPKPVQAPPPGLETWPPTLLMTVGFTEEAPDQTLVTVTTEPQGETTPAQVEAFVRERTGMTLGWTGSFDALEAMVS